MIKEEIEVSFEQLLTRIRELAHETNTRRLKVKRDDRVLLDIPLSAGILGGLIAPGLTALSTFAAIATNCTITIERLK